MICAMMQKGHDLSLYEASLTSGARWSTPTLSFYRAPPLRHEEHDLPVKLPGARLPCTPLNWCLGSDVVNERVASPSFPASRLLFKCQGKWRNFKIRLAAYLASVPHSKHFAVFILLRPVRIPVDGNVRVTARSHNFWNPLFFVKRCFFRDAFSSLRDTVPVW
ncbi:uncharacterized protein LAESUDRAFT_399977 [Laetiporus sulphureus 93-53]|uniref:Uncharacterized protein n=1 Tax=Laetiporus sulphureus 93-53 TaxID=1314785 RepID=A0A165CFL4_9APHY|nr:uncharacterized protein LAESUDRAFT_399977 [Laetiporus sulphureus 93-53]KZT02724.1 hypothetical protein LAESUDRAFT_399977 [Laetiporus sulphureus 93-53]